MDQTAHARGMRQVMEEIATWPPLVWVLLGVVTGFGWFGGTSVQVWTSESWMLQAAGIAMGNLSSAFSVFHQFAGFWVGGLNQVQVVSQTFGWSVQIALFLFAMGVEVPGHTKWRQPVCFFFCIVLTGANIVGDLIYASNFGFWGSVGFAAGVSFLSFFLGMASGACWIKAYDQFRSARRA